MTIDLLQPNKSDAINYLENNGSAPPRYAQATILNGATLQPFIQEWQVGPLPVGNGTLLTELNYIYNKGKGVQNYYQADAALIQQFQYNTSIQVQNITQKLLNGVRQFSPRC